MKFSLLGNLPPKWEPLLARQEEGHQCNSGFQCNTIMWVRLRHRRVRLGIRRVYVNLLKKPNTPPSMILTQFSNYLKTIACHILRPSLFGGWDLISINFYSRDVLL